MRIFKAFVSIAWLILLLAAMSGCGVAIHTGIDSLKPGLNKTETLAYPASQYPELQLAVSGTENVNKKELENLKALIIEALKIKGGTVIVENDKTPKLVVEVLEISKESAATKGLKLAIAEFLPGPILQTTSNAIEIKVFMEEKGKIKEFTEFQEFKEKMRDWEEMKKAVANRIADAVYFAH
jgi:hypothetical protein